MDPLTIVFFILGAIVASFAGVVAGRLHTGHSIVRGRSRCDACNRPLAPHALVPVLSHLLGGGRARCCGSKLSLAAPVSELALGALYVAAYLSLGLSWPLAVLLALLALLLALVEYDLAHQILPPLLLYLFVIGALAFRLLIGGDIVFALGVAALVGFFFLAMHVLSRGRAMGFADAPLALALSLIVGPELSFAGLAYSFWIGAVVGITILWRRPAGDRMGVEVPFAPFLAAGFLLAYFFIPWNPFAFIAALPS
jgi:prepilin signal peptidase PulO-like enzyme (type II secretory pathway)